MALCYKCYKTVYDDRKNPKDNEIKKVWLRRTLYNQGTNMTHIPF